MAVRFTLAGRIGVEADGVSVDDGLGRRGRLALAYLVSERHHPVGRDALAEVVWGEDLPSSWEQLLRGIASELRACLRTCGLDPAKALTTAFGAYQLHLPPDAAVDIEDAAAALEDAVAALASGHPQPASDLAAAAEVVVARQFLPGSGGAWVERRQAELRQLHVQALELMAEAAEANGDWHHAVRAAEEAVALEPYRESAYVRLMASHWATGNRAEALRAYERCRRVLSEELGVGPSPSTEAAYLTLLGDEPAAPAGRYPAPPTPGLPLPAALNAPPGCFLVGREADVAQLIAAFRRTSAEGCQTVLVGGEPGIGKTALVAQVARAAHAAGARVLYGHCEEGLGFPYQPIAEALGHYVANCPDRELEAHVAAHGGDLAHLVPELARRYSGVPSPSALDPEADRWRLFGAVSGMLSEAAGVAPLVVVFDDLHWAAAPMLLLVRHLLGSLATEPVTLLCTFRDTEIPPPHPLAQTLADLRRERCVERVSLRGLDQAAIAAFVEATGTRLADEGHGVLAQALRAHTGGNPFFVRELLRHLVETGSVSRRAGTWTYLASEEEGLGVSESVRDVVGRRLRRLPEATNAALRWAAVLGTTFELDLIERLSELAERDGALDAIEAAVASHLVTELGSGRYRFAHALVRDTIYSELTATRRARLHRQVGEAIESGTHADDVRLPALAHHFAEAATAGCAPKAADYAVAAARQALAQAAWETAVERLEAGLDALAAVDPPDLRRRCQLLLMIAETWTRFWDPPRAFTVAAEAVEGARALGSGELLGRATRWYLTSLGVGSGAQGDPDVGERLAQEALHALGEAQPALRAMILARLAGLPGPGVDPGDDATREALELARRSGDSEALGVALHMRCRALLGSEAPAEHHAVAEELVTAAPPDGWDGWRSGHELRGVARLVHGDRGGFDDDVAAVERLGAQRRFWYYRLVGARWRGTQALLDGRFDDAERLITEAADVPGALAVPGVVAIQMFKLRFEQGRLAEFVPDLSRAVDEASDNVRAGLVPGGGPVLRQGLRSMLAFAQVAIGDHGRGTQEFDALIEGLPNLPRWPRPVVLAYLAELASALGDVGRAAEVYTRLRPYAGQVVATGSAVHCPGAVDRFLGQLAATMGRFGDAEEHYEAALNLDAGLRSPPLVARTRYWYGKMLVAAARPGDAELANRLLADSLSTTDQLGMHELACAARGLLGRV
jgi:DNA-binding SARP family transcriptional activator